MNGSENNLRKNQKVKEFSNEWLLLSILLASKKQPADLASIIAIGDGINHAVFTFSEMRDGLKQLIAADYVQRVGDRYQPTKAAFEEYNDISKKTKSIHKQLELLRSKLISVPSDKIDKHCSFGLSQKFFQEAVDSYFKQFDGQKD